MNRRKFLSALPLAPAVAVSASQTKKSTMYSMPETICACGFTMRLDGPITIHHTVHATCFNVSCHEFSKVRLVHLEQVKEAL